VSEKPTEASRSLREPELVVITFYYYEELTTEEITFLVKRTEFRLHQIHAFPVSSLLTELELRRRIHELAA
jgi:DNA-directed RNA polymerase specialized sigma subunit